MNPNDTPKSVAPAIPVSPEDDPKLQAIEALEARPDDLYPKPTPLEAVIAPEKPKEAPKPPEPVAKPVVEPVITPPPVVQPAAPVIVDVIPPPVPVKVIPEKPKTAAEEIADEIANNPPTRKPFKFFINQKISKRSIVIIFSIIALILIGIGCFVVLQPKF